MEKILEFLKSLVVPRKMAKYRYMSVLLSIIIFMASVYLFSVPMANHINKSQPELKQSYNYLALQEIETRLDDNEESLNTLKSLANLECTVVENKLECANIDESKIFEKDVVITVNGITKRIKFKVDLNSESPTFEEVVIDIKDVPYVDNEEVYLVLFLPYSIYYQAHQRGIDEKLIKHNNVDIKLEFRNYDYQTFMSDFNLKYDEASARSIGRFIVDDLVQADIKQLNSQLFLYLFFIMFVLPILFVLIFWVVFKKNGKLTTYKEYYNIAAIASIVPIVLTFIVAWFYREAIEYYMYAFSLFYLYTLYRINNSPDEVM